MRLDFWNVVNRKMIYRHAYTHKYTLKSTHERVGGVIVRGSEGESESCGPIVLRECA